MIQPSDGSDTRASSNHAKWYMDTKFVELRHNSENETIPLSSISGYLQYLAPSHKAVLRPCASMDSSQRATVTERGPFKSATGAKNLSVEMYIKLDDGSYLDGWGWDLVGAMAIHEYHIMHELKRSREKVSKHQPVKDKGANSSIIENDQHIFSCHLMPIFWTTHGKTPIEEYWS